MQLLLESKLRAHDVFVGDLRVDLQPAGERHLNSEALAEATNRAALAATKN